MRHISTAFLRFRAGNLLASVYSFACMGPPPFARAAYPAGIRVRSAERPKIIGSGYGYSTVDACEPNKQLV